MSPSVLLGVAVDLDDRVVNIDLHHTVGAGEQISAAGQDARNRAATASSCGHGRR